MQADAPHGPVFLVRHDKPETLGIVVRVGDTGLTIGDVKTVRPHLLTDFDGVVRLVNAD